MFNDMQYMELYHGITESQNGQGWKGPQKFI